MHGTRDSVIPISHSEELIKKLKEGVLFDRLLVLEGGDHNDLIKLFKAKIYKKIREFLKEIVNETYKEETINNSMPSQILKNLMDLENEIKEGIKSKTIKTNMAENGDKEYVATEKIEDDKRNNINNNDKDNADSENKGNLNRDIEIKVKNVNNGHSKHNHHNNNPNYISLDSLDSKIEIEIKIKDRSKFNIENYNKDQEKEIEIASLNRNIIENQNKVLCSDYI